jgi:NAD(P)-dependent dehydrogenase (short-subunit alcohol dehydrogenase family)
MMCMLRADTGVLQEKSRNRQVSSRNWAVSPGAIRTELGGGLNDEFEALLAAQTALGRVGEPEDVARVIASLLSQDGGWINAQIIEVSGGYNI